MATCQGAKANANLVLPSRRVPHGLQQRCMTVQTRFRLEMAICCMPRHCMQAGAAGAEPPAPKKRGRPRKNPDVVVSEADLKGKARRGRPRASKVKPWLMQRSMRAPCLEAADCLQPAVGLHAELASLLKMDALLCNGMSSGSSACP